MPYQKASEATYVVKRLKLAYTELIAGGPEGVGQAADIIQGILIMIDPDYKGEK